MFADHQPVIAAWARQSPDNFADVLAFVHLTIQQPIDTVPAALADVRNVGHASKYLWGNKAVGYRHVVAHKDAIFADFMELSALADPERRRHEALEYFAMLPGLGQVKAGFVLQLTMGEVGCLDTHNIERYGLIPTGRRELPAWMRGNKFKAASPAKRQEHIRAYISACDQLGGCEKLWNAWCTYVADKYPVRYPGGAFEVSKLHCDAILPA